MAWNEPGDNNSKNNGDRDPWGGGRRNGGDQKGPPDLDEVFRKLRNTVNGLFGGGKRAGNSGGGGFGRGTGKLGNGTGGLIVIGIVVVLALWLYNAIYVVDEQEQAVILRFGKYHETVGPGLNFYFPPMDRRFQENVTRERAYSKQGQMLTEDENIVEVPLTVQYKINNLKDFVLNVDQPESSLQNATESALRHVAGSTTMDRILTEGREQMAIDVRERLQRFLDNYRTGITVTQVNIQSAQAPREVQEAFDDVIRAREDEQREKNQAEAYANGVVPEARGRAQRIIEDANGYRDEVIARAQGEAERFTRLLTEYRKAPEVTRERLYLEAMQDVFSQTSKILITGQQGQNLFYLPLDKMIGGHEASNSTASYPPNVPLGAAAASANTAPTTRDGADARQPNVRTRESR